MRCNEMQEYLVDLLYNDTGTPPASTEVQEHLKTCPACRREFEELKQTRSYLRTWEDESPLRSVTIPSRERSLRQRAGWRYARYAAIAAMLLLCVLALANTEVTVSKNSFSISTHFLPQKQSQRDYYTKAELREIIDDSESRMKEINWITAQRVLEAVEQDQAHYLDARLTGHRTAQSRNKN
jgi:predicted anti-sigma-YlaC factor YlaD